MHRLIRILSLILLAALTHAAFTRWSEMATAVQTAPGVVQTSGCEEESLFALWRTVHAGTPYLDSLRSPYASAYFNWLFYRAYALAISPFAAAHGDQVIPWASRTFTLAGAVLGASAAGFLFRRILAAANPALLPLGLPAGLFLFLGPLAGWWSFTARPDIWALACETFAVALCLLGFRRRSPGVTVAVTLLLYASWAFKQNYVVGLGAILVLLGCHRRWREAGLMAGLSVVLWGVTALILGPEYRTCLANATAAPSFYPGLGLSNLTSALIKAGPFVLLLPGAVLALLRLPRRGCPDDPASLAISLGAIGTLVGLLLAFPSSCVLGATQNYYFSAVLFASVAVCGSLARDGRTWATLGFLTTAVLLVTAPALGLAPPISLRAPAEELSARWGVWTQQPEPRFSSDLRLNLPWLCPGSPPLVLAYKYPQERARKRAFEAGGVGGLIERGYFQSLLLPGSTGSRYDGGDLGRYERVQVVGSLALYRRKAPRAGAD